MKNMNITSPTAAKIFASWEKEGRSERPRTYLGASIVGHHCDMYLWLNFRGVVRENFDGRMYRLFDRGKREEAVFCNDLRRIGCEVKEFDENGNQFEVSDLGGHFSGHLDGVVRGLPESPTEWHVVEFKTHSDASFKKLCKEGVKSAKPMHYAQMTVYMGQTGLKRALYMAVDKDDDNLWVERIEFVKSDYEAIMARAKHIIDTSSPSRCSSRRDDFRCKACPCASVCWHDSKTFVDPSVPQTCRTCCFSTADTEHYGATWKCERGHSCTTDGCCDDYLVIPTLVDAEVKEGDEDGILYSFESSDGKKTGGIMIGRNGFSLDEVKKFGHDKPVVDAINTIKDEIPGAKVVSNNDIERKYHGDGFESYFSGTREELMAWYENNRFFDMTKPIREEDGSESDFFEYADGWCVENNRRSNRFTVWGEKPPF